MPLSAGPCDKYITVKRLREKQIKFRVTEQEGYALAAVNDPVRVKRSGADTGGDAGSGSPAYSVIVVAVLFDVFEAVRVLDGRASCGAVEEG